jgi:hypothetical protein
MRSEVRIMHAHRHVFLAALLAVAFVLTSAGTRADSETDDLLASDEKLLRDAGLGTDAGALLDFFRKRTLTEADRDRLTATVRLLGDKSFRARERASAELISAGRAALPFLRPAQLDPDREVARRASRCIEEIERGSSMSLAEAAARLLVARKPPRVIEVLLAFLPWADQESVEEEVHHTLLALGMQAGKPIPALTAALADPDPARRAAAAFVVGQAKDADQRRAAARLLTDREARVRFQAAVGLVAAGDKSAMPTLVALLDEGPLPLAQRAEEQLYRIARDQAPSATLGKTDAASRRRCRDEWEAWWRTNADKLDLARVNRDQRLLGLTLVCEAHLPDGGRVFECAADGIPRWVVKVQNPIDACALPNGRVLISDCHGGRVVEMDQQGKVTWTHKIESPIGCQRLANGNTFINTYTQVTEVTRDGKPVYTHTLPGSCYYARKLRDGHFVCVDNLGTVFELDSAGKQVHRVALGNQMGQSWAGVEMLLNGHLLVSLGGSHKVVETDWSGKVYWERSVHNPNSATRLPNGHTLVASHDDACVYEFDRSGKQVWQRKLEGHPFRVRRR